MIAFNNIQVKEQMKYLGFLFLVSTLALSCNKEEGLDTIDPDLRPYFLMFQEEALTRGHNISIMDSSLIAVLSTDLPNNIIGQCQHNTTKPNEIKISKRTWQNFTAIQREYVVFHELGHCILHRSHTDVAYSNGNCKSIMESGLGECRNIYSSSNRSLYLNELFEN